jgi:hypothetical protein
MTVMKKAAFGASETAAEFAAGYLGKKVGDYAGRAIAEIGPRLRRKIERKGRLTGKGLGLALAAGTLLALFVVRRRG